MRSFILSQYHTTRWS